MWAILRSHAHRPTYLPPAPRGLWPRRPTYLPLCHHAAEAVRPTYCHASLIIQASLLMTETSCVLVTTKSKFQGRSSNLASERALDRGQPSIQLYEPSKSDTHASTLTTMFNYSEHTTATVPPALPRSWCCVPSAPSVCAPTCSNCRRTGC